MKLLNFEMPPEGFKRLFYDIETSYEIGKFWRPSFKAVIRHTDVFIESAIICISYKWEGQKEIQSLRWKEGEEREVWEEWRKKRRKEGRKKWSNRFCHGQS